VISFLVIIHLTERPIKFLKSIYGSQHVMRKTSQNGEGKVKKLIVIFINLTIIK